MQYWVILQYGKKNLNIKEINFIVLDTVEKENNVGTKTEVSTIRTDVAENTEAIAGLSTALGETNAEVAKKRKRINELIYSALKEFNLVEDSKQEDTLNCYDLYDYVFIHI